MTKHLKTLICAASVLAATAVTTVEARGFSAARSFSVPRVASTPSRAAPVRPPVARPQAQAPAPKPVEKTTTVINQQSSGGGFFSSLTGAFTGAAIFNLLFGSDGAPKTSRARSEEPGS